MHQEIGVADARGELTGRGSTAAVGAAIDMGCGREIGGTERTAVARASNEIVDAGAVGSRRGAENARERP